jgi:hypothetical protein
MTKRVVIVGLFVMLMSLASFAGVVDFTVTTDLTKEPAVCATATSTDCVFGTQVFYMQGTTRVNVASAVLPATASGSAFAVPINNVTVRKYGRGVIFQGVMQARDSTGAVIESNPTSAAPVDLIPGKPTLVAIVQ